MAKKHTKGMPRKIEYQKVLKKLSKNHPISADLLSNAQLNREKYLNQYIGGYRLAGFEELISHLTQIEAVFKKSKKLRDIAFLIERSKGDFVTALEATLSGFPLVAFEAMRDVMEIEFLLRDFYYENSNINEWLNNKHEKKFRPFQLRKRHADRLGKQPHDINEAVDYKGHSMFLHVTPYPNPIGKVGINIDQHPFFFDFGFCELFEHALKLLIQIHGLRRKLARHIKSPWGPERGLKRFRKAWEATQEMKDMTFAMMGAANVNNQEE